MDRWSSSSDVCTHASDASIIKTNIINRCWRFYHFLCLLSLYLSVCFSCVSNFLFGEIPPSANVLSSLAHYIVSSSSMFVYDGLLVIIVIAYIIESFLMTNTGREETHSMWNYLLFVCIFCAYRMLSIALLFQSIIHMIKEMQKRAIKEVHLIVRVQIICIYAS